MLCTGWSSVEARRGGSLHAPAIGSLTPHSAYSMGRSPVRQIAKHSQAQRPHVGEINSRSAPDISEIVTGRTRRKTTRDHRHAECHQDTLRGVRTLTRSLRKFHGKRRKKRWPLPPMPHFCIPADGPRGQGDTSALIREGRPSRPEPRPGERGRAYKETKSKDTGRRTSTRRGRLQQSSVYVRVLINP